MPLITAKLNELLAVADERERSCLLAASSRESGLWLQAVPIPSLGTSNPPVR